MEPLRWSDEPNDADLESEHERRRRYARAQDGWDARGVFRAVLTGGVVLNAGRPVVTDEGWLDPVPLTLLLLLPLAVSYGFDHLRVRHRRRLMVGPAGARQDVGSHPVLADSSIRLALTTLGHLPGRVRGGTALDLAWTEDAVLLRSSGALVARTGWRDVLDVRTTTDHDTGADGPAVQVVVRPGARVVLVPARTDGRVRPADPADVEALAGRLHAAWTAVVPDRVDRPDTA